MKNSDVLGLLSSLRSGEERASEVPKRNLIELVHKILASPMAGMTRDGSPKAFEKELGRIVSIYLDGNMSGPEDIASAIGTGISFETLLVFTHILHAYMGMTSSASAIVDGNIGAIQSMSDRFSGCRSDILNGHMTIKDTIPVPLGLAVESLSLLTEIAKLGQTMSVK